MNYDYHDLAMLYGTVDFTIGRLTGEPYVITLTYLEVRVFSGCGREGNQRF